MNDPRKHHYVPCAYLAGFAEPASRRLHVFDRRNSKTFCTTPENVGHQRDFYRVDTNEVLDDEFVVERQVFQRVDDDGLAAVRRFADDSQGADRQTREMATGYMAAAYLRTPKVREKMGQLTDRMFKAWIAEMFSDDREFEQFIKHIPEERRRDPEFDLQQLRKFGLSPADYTVSLDKNWIVGLSLEAIIPIATRGLNPRAWVVVRADEGEHFITCDQPLTLVPVGPVDGPIVRLDSPDTIVMFPVDRERALVGLGKGAVQRGLMPRGVPAVNRATAMQSHRHVFASAADFAWEDETESIIGSREYLALGAPGPDPAVEHYPIPPRPR